MSKDAVTLHGSVFFLLQKFVISTYGESTWKELNEFAGTGHQSFSIRETYQASLMEALIDAASKKSGIPINDLKEKFGFFIVPDLLEHYKEYIDPSWKTREMIEKTESVMHKAVRERYKNANPPVLNINRVSDKLMFIDYYSKRKMAGFAVGILKGIAAHYKEDGNIKITAVTDPDKERVQIKVEFLNS